MYDLIASKVRTLCREFGTQPPSAITADVWKEYLKRRRQERSGRYKRRLSIMTLSHERMVMRMILDVAISKKLLTHKPDLWVPRVKKGKGQGRDDGPAGVQAR
jgi:hypothetical protein